VATAPENLRPAQARVGRDLVRDARLADARLAHEQKDAAATAHRILDTDA